VLGRDGTITEFITTGVTAAERAAIDHIPVGLGILGVLIDDARPLRLHDIADDERALVLLAAQAGVAIENAHLYEDVTDRAQRLEALRAITTAILAGVETGELLALVVRHARELAGADVATLALPAGEGHLRVEAADGLFAEELRGTSFPLAGTVTGEVIRTGKAVVLADASADERSVQPIVRPGGRPGPVRAPGRARPDLRLADGGQRRAGAPLRDADVQLVETFAEQAAVALEYARLQAELQRLAVLEDRERIAKDLHDGAIQALFAVGMGLQGAALLAGDDELRGRLQHAVDELDRVIRDLRNYIFGLRPGILADRHLDQALQELAADLERRTGILMITQVDPGAGQGLGNLRERGPAPGRPGRDLQHPRGGDDGPDHHPRPTSGTRVTLWAWTLP
jgi:signal transduction histidine kinase